MRAKDASTVEEQLEANEVAKEYFEEGVWVPSWGGVEFVRPASLQRPPRARCTSLPLPLTFQQSTFRIHPTQGTLLVHSEVLSSPAPKPISIRHVFSPVSSTPTMTTPPDQSRPSLRPGYCISDFSRLNLQARYRSLTLAGRRRLPQKRY